jgi:hypothetical protein
MTGEVKLQTNTQRVYVECAPSGLGQKALGRFLAPLSKSGFARQLEESQMNKSAAAIASRPLSELYVEDLQKIIRDTFADLVREIVRQEQRPSYYLDDSGHKIFFNEYGYSRFVESHPDKLPSELRASFIDAQGYRCHYSDYEMKPAARRRGSPGKPISSEEMKRRLRKNGVKV